MAKAIVGWFAVVVGLMLAIHNGFAIYHVLHYGNGPAGVRYAQAGMRCVMLLAGAALVVFGLMRLSRRDAEAE